MVTVSSAFNTNAVSKACFCSPDSVVRFSRATLKNVSISSPFERSTVLSDTCQTGAEGSSLPETRVVEDGTIEPAMGNGKFIASLEQVTVQLSRTAANPQLLCHELAEAEMWLTSANGFVSDAEMALYQAFQSFM